MINLKLLILGFFYLQEYVDIHVENLSFLEKPWFKNVYITYNLKQLRDSLPLLTTRQS